MSVLASLQAFTQADLENTTLYFEFDSRRERVWVFFDAEPDDDRPRALVLTIRGMEDE